MGERRVEADTRPAPIARESLLDQPLLLTRVRTVFDGCPHDAVERLAALIDQVDVNMPVADVASAQEVAASVIHVQTFAEDAAG
jgi:hypothetical protein